MYINRSILYSLYTSNILLFVGDFTKSSPSCVSSASKTGSERVRKHVHLLLTTWMFSETICWLVAPKFVGTAETAEAQFQKRTYSKIHRISLSFNQHSVGSHQRFSFACLWLNCARVYGGLGWSSHWSPSCLRCRESPGKPWPATHVAPPPTCQTHPQKWDTRSWDIPQLTVTTRIITFCHFSRESLENMHCPTSVHFLEVKTSEEVRLFHALWRHFSAWIWLLDNWKHVTNECCQQNLGSANGLLWQELSRSQMANAVWNGHIIYLPFHMLQVQIKPSQNIEVLVQMIATTDSETCWYAVFFIPTKKDRTSSNVQISRVKVFVTDLLRFPTSSAFWWAMLWCNLSMVHLGLQPGGCSRANGSTHFGKHGSILA